jgi:Fibronectin type III domain
MRALAIALAVLLSAPAAAAANPQVLKFDGGDFDRAAAIATDSAGNTYVGGSAESRDGAHPFIVIKLGPDGTRQWTARYNGSRGGTLSEARAVAVDSAGNIYAAGYIDDGVIFSPNFDYLVVKFGPDGVQRWAQRYNGPGDNNDFPTQVVVDAAGNAIVTGYSYGQGYDWATLKFSPDGALLWERRHTGPGNSDDRAMDMGLLPNGNLVVSGIVQNRGDGMTNDAETIAYSPAGAVVWRATFTDTALSHEQVAALDIDSSGRVTITGTTAENASPYVFPFPLTLRYDAGGSLLQTIRSDGGSSVDVTPAGGFYVAGALTALDASTVARFDAAGNRVWAAPLTVADREALQTAFVAAHASGMVTVAATVTDTSTGNGDYLTIRFDADGRELWRHRFSGLNDPGQHDFVAGLAVDSADAALVTGTTWNDYVSSGGTATDIDTLKFAAGATPALVAPSQLEAQGLSTSQIRLSWRDNSGTEDGFRVERCQGSGCTAFAQVAVVGRDVTSHVDAGLVRNTAYSYRVRAFNAGGASTYSNVATAKTRRR